MAQTLILNGAQTAVINALDTYNYTVKTAAVHYASIQMSVIPASGLSILIKQNSSTIASFSSPAPMQNVIDLACNINAAVSDVISFVISSSSPIDQQLNTIKGIINIHVGSNN